MLYSCNHMVTVGVKGLVSDMKAGALIVAAGGRCGGPHSGAR